MSYGDGVCLACKGGFHDECIPASWGELDAELACCCRGQYTLEQHATELMKEKIGAVISDTPSEKNPLKRTGAPDVDEPKRGNSGYISPEAWPSARDIGTIKGLPSTGRKRAKTMYPTPIGHKCEWAGLAAAGGGIEPIVGCLGNPATDLHHGPDKNTLNNERISAGIGNAQNVHLICSDCHNAWHGANNKHYPERDHTADQARPWLPIGVVHMHDAETLADDETLYAVDRERKKARKDHERHTGGRTDRTYTGGDFDIRSDDELDGDVDAAGGDTGLDPDDPRRDYPDGI